MKFLSRLKTSLKKRLSPFFPLFRRKKKTLLLAAFFLLAAVLLYTLVAHDSGAYRETVAKVTSVTETKSQGSGTNGYSDVIYHQNLKAVLLNGPHKGEKITLQNTASYSEAYDLHLKVNDEVFVSAKTDGAGKLSYQIVDAKRDKSIAYIAILFLVFILLIGGFKGFRSLLSVLLNIILFSVVIRLCLFGLSPMLLTSAAGVFFIAASILLVSGANKKSYSAMLATAAGTLLTMLITVAVIAACKANGVHYDQMEFMTQSPEQVFLAEILIGTLGGIMDIAITISSAVQELCASNPGIDRKSLVRSGMEIGQDVMGTMTNTLLFAYLSGSIPMILLWLRNGYSMSTILGINLSLEIIRALTGSIGIVISIPLALTISILLFKKEGRERVDA